MPSKYNFETCQTIAKKYSCRSEFKKGARCAYKAAISMGWIDMLFPERMLRILDRNTCERLVKEKKYSCPGEMKRDDSSLYTAIRAKGWLDLMPLKKIFHRELTRENCIEFGKKYKNSREMYLKDMSLYKKCKEFGVLSELFPVPYKRKKVNNSIFTKEYCREIASRCNSIASFKRMSEHGYEVSRKNGWVHEFASEFNYLSTGDAIRISRGFMSDSEIETVARKYKTVKEFRKKDERIYTLAVSHGIINSFTFLRRVPDDERWYEDYVYVYEFPETNTAYVGRTGCMKRRHREHCDKRDKIRIYADSIGIAVPQPKVLHNKLSMDEGPRMEGLETERYKKEGWNMLNEAKPGSLGGLANSRSYRKALEASKKYEYFKDLCYGDVNLYHFLRNNDLIGQCTWLKRTPRNKHIHQYSVDGNFINSYPSIAEAGRAVGVSAAVISGCLRGKYNTAKGFIWKYADQEEAA